MSKDRSSKWAFLVYPDSAPNDWRRLLQLSYISCAVSPLHSPDALGDEGERKQHWHILLDYDSLKSFDQVKALSDRLNGARPIIIDNPSGYYKYMVHACNPEKEQFPNGFLSITNYNGFDPDRFNTFTKKQVDSFKKDITYIIEKNNITEYESLVCFIRDNSDKENYDNYFNLVVTNTIFFNSFLCSRRNRLKKTDVDNFNKRISKIEELLKHGSRA